MVETTSPINQEGPEPQAVESKLPDLSKLTLDQIMTIGGEAVEEALKQIRNDAESPAISGWQSAA